MRQWHALSLVVQGVHMVLLHLLQALHMLGEVLVAPLPAFFDATSLFAMPPRNRCANVNLTNKQLRATTYCSARVAPKPVYEHERTK